MDIEYMYMYIYIYIFNIYTIESIVVDCTWKAEVHTKQSALMNMQEKLQTNVNICKYSKNFKGFVIV